MLKLLPIVSWEPARIRFIFENRSHAKAELVKMAALQWFRSRQSLYGCGCELRNLDVKSKSVSVFLEVEWVCAKCVHGLVQAVAEKFPKLISVELGTRATRRLGSRGNCISVTSQMVEFEDGQKQRVRAFRVKKYPVTIGEFEIFTESTGYITTAEKTGNVETFRHNSSLSGVIKQSQSAMPVCFISFDDAIAYCAHMGFRLPTESEWLAVAIGKAKEHRMNASEELKLMTRMMKSSPQKCIVSAGWDITASKTDAGFVIVRQGPLYFRTADWREPHRVDVHRRLVRCDEFDVMTTFRVVEK